MVSDFFNNLDARLKGIPYFCRTGDTYSPCPAISCGIELATKVSFLSFDDNNKNAARKLDQLYNLYLLTQKRDPFFRSPARVMN